MIDSKFLETYPLYKPCKFVLTPTDKNICPIGYRDGENISLPLQIPAITMYCRLCKSLETFNYRQDKRSLQKGIYPEVFYKGECLKGIFYISYSCHSCYQVNIDFLLKFENDKISKVGQSPSPIYFIDIPDSVKKALEPRGELGIYRKGIINESVGFGIGSFSYYRRIVENYISYLLEDIRSFASEEYEAALKTLKESYVATEKIKVVKELLPDRLKIGGSNPLSEIYNILSIGLHSLTDEECLDYSSALRQVLTSLIEEVYCYKHRSKDYASALAKIKIKN